MIRRLFARWGRARIVARPQRGCGCPPWFHDLGVHAPGHCGESP